MKTAFAYARYSSDRQNEESIEAQLRAIEIYARKNDIEIIKIYTDEAKTGTNDEREGFQLMISELKQYKPDLVLTHKMDRFARNRYDSAIYKREIQRAGARYIAVDQPIEDSPEGIILESLLEGMAEYYSKNLSREVSLKMKEYAYKAQHLGGIPPLGFMVGKDKQYLINEEEAETVRIIFNMKLNGFSYSDIIKELSLQDKKTKAGNPFGKNSIYDILRNEKYCGTYTYNTTPNKINGKRNNRVKKPIEEQVRIEDAIPAIISKEEWNQVQSILDGNKNVNARQIDKSVYTLTGVLYCGHCGSAMAGHPRIKTNAKGERVTYRYYRCTKNKNNKECSHNTRYPAQELEEKVYKAIEAKANQIGNIKAFADLLWEEIQKANTDQSKEKTVLKKQLAEVEKKLQNYYKAIESGVNSQYVIEPLNEAGKLKQELEERLNQIKHPFEDVTKKEILDYLKAQKGIKIPRNNIEVCKKIVTDHVESVTVYTKNHIEIVLKYNFPVEPNSGGGGGTPNKVLLFKVSA